METQNWGPISGLKDELLKNSRRYGFVQSHRLLRYWLDKFSTKEVSVKDVAKAIRVRPELSMHFPGTDITEISEISSGSDNFLITATFLGLYGVSSPLPTFYTEDMIDESLRDITVTRDFIDIINSPFYRLFYGCWEKYRAYIKIIELNDPAYLDYCLCLLGFGTDSLRRRIKDANSLLRYIGLFTQFPRSSLALKTLLSDVLNEPELTILECIPRMVNIPDDQLCFIGVSGNILGEDAYLGQEIPDRMGAFRIQAGPLDAQKFRRIFPDTDAFSTMAAMIRLFMDQPLEWDFEVILESRQVKPTCLGADRWSRLGWETWLISDDTIENEERVRFSCFDDFMTFYDPSTKNWDLKISSGRDEQ